MLDARWWSMVLVVAGCAGQLAKPAVTYVKPSDSELRKRLTPMQYQVMQQDGTEPPYRNDYWDNHAAGLYVDVVTGQPLFVSVDKYDSKTGWPSFTRPVAPESVVERPDYRLGYLRREVRSTGGHSHLGHIFEDGPRPTGLRYCINSAALRFIPLGDLKTNGYGSYLSRFASEFSNVPR
jgi:peptide methionine sulfoxide reductase msrA/msrB